MIGPFKAKTCVGLTGWEEHGEYPTYDQAVEQARRAAARLARIFSDGRYVLAVVQTPEQARMKVFDGHRFLPRSTEVARFQYGRQV